MDFFDMPGWKVTIEELSAGVYKLKAHHWTGASVDVKATDPEELARKLREYAERTQLN